MSEYDNDELEGESWDAMATGRAKGVRMIEAAQRAGAAGEPFDTALRDALAVYGYPTEPGFYWLIGMVAHNAWQGARRRAGHEGHPPDRPSNL